MVSTRSVLVPMAKGARLQWVAPMQEHALEYFAAPWQGEAYAGMLDGRTVTG